MTDLSKFKPLLPELISFYYNECDQNTGGQILHYLLDDGNISHEGITNDLMEAEDKGEHLVALICRVLLMYTEEELELMYDNDWKILK